MRNRLLALGLFSVGAIHSVLAAPSDPGALPGETPPLMVLQDGSGHGPMLHGPSGFAPLRMVPPPEFMLAAWLAALETRAGIRTGQLDAWRDYTSALQAVLLPPRPHPGPVGPGGPGAPGGKPDAFAFQEGLADDITARAVAASRLKEAIATLRARLSPEQLEILASGGTPAWPPGALGWHAGDAAGPWDLPNDGMQLPPPWPGNAGQP